MNRSLWIGGKAAAVGDYALTAFDSGGLTRIPCFDRLKRGRRGRYLERPRVDVNPDGLGHYETGAIRTSVGAVTGDGSCCR